MFKRKTVFVIGAGCSAEFGLPVGWELRDNIDAILGDRTAIDYDIIVRAVGMTGLPINEYEVENRIPAFRQGLYSKPSIDQYLDFHRDDPVMVMIGKCAIAHAIMVAESKSDLSIDAIKEKGLRGVSGTWLDRLFHFMNDGTDKSAPERIFDNVSFVCFNYDRCIEVFFRYALGFLTHSSFSETERWVSRLKVWHPYGKVGNLLPGNLHRPMLVLDDVIMQRQHVANAAKSSLRTFTERMDETPQRDEIRAQIQNAEQLIFLGFSYLDQNMELIKPPQASNAKSVIGTSYKMSRRDASFAEGAINSLVWTPGGQFASCGIELVDAKAATVIADYGNAMRR